MANTKTKITADLFKKLPLELEQTALASAGMLFHDAINLVEGHGSEQKQRFEVARKSIEQHIAETTDFEEKGVGYFYLLRILLSGHIFHENKQARTLYKNMLENLRQAEHGYAQDLKLANSRPDKKVIKKQIEAFYQLVDSYLKTLEVLYEHKGMLHAHDRLHEERMRFRSRGAQMTGNHISHLGHLFLQHTSNYGHSFIRWGVTVMLFMCVFALVFLAIDYFASWQGFSGITTETPFDYLYFSMVSFTTVGYGDITPLTNLGKIIAGFESLLGYLMLGVFITLIQKRL